MPTEPVVQCQLIADLPHAEQQSQHLARGFPGYESKTGWHVHHSLSLYPKIPSDSHHQVLLRQLLTEP